MSFWTLREHRSDQNRFNLSVNDRPGDVKPIQNVHEVMGEDERMVLLKKQLYCTMSEESIVTPRHVKVNYRAYLPTPQKRPQHQM
jgi:hypothetical protein